MLRTTGDSVFIKENYIASPGVSVPLLMSAKDITISSNSLAASVNVGISTVSYVKALIDFY
jgi:hypothetical protein